jgi:hypothetical protein
MWWGADISAISDIIGTVQPVVIGFSVTWDDLLTHTWDELLLNTWDQPLTIPVVIQTDISPQSSLRKFAKFKKSLRFRQINFQIEFSYDGTSASGPARFFTITTIIATRQNVSKALT